MVHATTETKKIRTLIKNLHLRRRLNNYLLFSLPLLLLACQENTLYHSYHPVESTGWKKNDTLFYVIPSVAISNNQQIEIGIRHKDSYPYRDIWLSISHQENTDTIHLYMADSNGSWKGHGIGETRQYSEILSDIKLSTTDSTMVLKLAHIMQDSILNGINDIGIHFMQKP